MASTLGVTGSSTATLAGTNIHGGNMSDKPHNKLGITEAWVPFDTEGAAKISKITRNAKYFTTLLLIIIVIIASGILLNRGLICVLK